MIYIKVTTPDMIYWYISYMTKIENIDLLMLFEICPCRINTCKDKMSGYKKGSKKTDEREKLK